MNNLSKYLGFFAMTEKSCVLKEKLGQITFVTGVKVTKGQFKSAFNRCFKDQELISLSSMIVKGKLRRFRGKTGCRSDRKKFVALIKNGKSFDLEKL